MSDRLGHADRMIRAAEAAAARQGIARAAKAMDWLGERTGGLLETDYYIFPSGPDDELLMHFNGFRWVDGMKVDLRSPTDDFRCSYAASLAVMMRIARDMLTQYESEAAAGGKWASRQQSSA